MLKRNVFVAVGLGLVLTSTLGCMQIIESMTDQTIESTNDDKDPLADCADVCHKLETLGCPQGDADCTTRCQEEFAMLAPACQDELGAYFSCIVENVTICGSDICSPLATPVNTCDDMYGM